MIYKRKSIDYLKHLLCLLCFLINLQSSLSMTKQELRGLRDEVKELFYHGYNGYMTYAFPADELMPLSCRGRYRDTEPNRGDIDDVLGNFSLTLIDSMDSLVIMNNLTEFEKSVNNVIKHVQFDSDIVVSVFETNIRVVGGLLSGHVLANLIKDQHPQYLQNYNNELLDLAKDCALRLLPAFDTLTGIPYPRINLKYGMNSTKIQSVKDTCTACAGTIILEFAALSRLTNDTIFEQKARKAMDYLWRQRHRSSDLVGSILNINNGDWINRNSGVGAGSDSYFEYLLKAYILLGDESYLKRFNRHYQGIMKYISQGPLLVDVHMHKPRLNAKSHMDSLLAFWPGLQVLKGDLIPAIETHEILYQVSRMHNHLLPEAFSINDFQPYWSQFLIRPEFIESTYFLYEALKDEHYQEVGKQLLKSIKKYTKTSCGFAALRDVRTGIQDDRMDSFVLSETLKYLYLLFADKEDLIIDLNQFVFTTEAHFLPLSLSSIPDKARFTNGTLSSLTTNNDTNINNEININDEQNRQLTCPNLNNLFKEQLERKNFLYFKNRSNKSSTTKQPSINYYANIRANLKNYVELSNFDKMKYNSFNLQTFRDLDFNGNFGTSTANNQQHEQLVNVEDLDLDLNAPIRLEPSEFSITNPEHLKVLKTMGINVIQASPNDPIQLLHLMSSAEDVKAGNEGIIFIKKMIRLSKKQTLTFGNFISFVKFNLPFNDNKNYVEITLPTCIAQFGVLLNKDERMKFSAELSLISPKHACNGTDEYFNDVNGKFGIVERGDCAFITKVRNVEKMGALGVIIVDNVKDSSALTIAQFEMLGDGKNDVKIPAVLLYRKEADILLDALELNPNLIAHITNIVDETEEKPMIKLVNSLKEARRLLDLQFEKQSVDVKQEAEEIEDESMIKLVNNLKEAKRLIDLQLEKQSVDVKQEAEEIEDESMIKLVNNLKEARRLIDLQLEKQSVNVKQEAEETEDKSIIFTKSLEEARRMLDLHFEKQNNELKVKKVKDEAGATKDAIESLTLNNQNSLNDIKEDLDNLRNLLKDKVDDLLGNDRLQVGLQKLVDEYGRLKHLVNKHHFESLPSLVKKLEPNIKELFESEKGKKMLSSMGLGDLSIDNLFGEFELNLKGMKMPSLSFSKATVNRLLKGALKDAKGKSSCSRKNAADFRNYIINEYWSCR